MTRIQSMARFPRCGALVGVLLLTACSEEPSEKACTTIGCVNGFSVDFTPNAGWPAGNYEFVLELDGESTTCSGSLPLPTCGTNALTCTPASDRFVISESGCALVAGEHGFAGVHVSAPNPTTVKLSISRDGSPLVDRSWTPAYQTSQPNGPGCEPTCTTARDTLTVP